MIRMPMRRFHSPLLDRTYGGIYALHMENLHDIAITTRGLTKVYGGIKRVDDVSLSVRQGEIYGLIGRNGAGKTTLLRMLLGIASPTSGEVAFFGESSPHALAKARSKCGALIEQPAFYPRLNAKENLDVYARATGAPRPDVSALLSLVGLGDCGRKSVRNFSLGMKQRLAIAMALIGDPDMLFLRWVADVIVQERVLTNYAGNQNIPSRASGENLDSLGELFYATERPQAQPAVCTERFYISEAQTTSILVPEGTRVTDMSNSLIWETVEDAYIAIGDTYTDVQVRCQTPGSVGNGYAKGQLSTIVDLYDYYSKCENITASDGGADEASSPHARG